MVTDGRGDFSGLWIPVVTPFRRGKLDLPATKRLVQRLCADGVSGIVVCGSTGEAAALEKAEQVELLAATLGAADGLPVVMGLSGYNLPQTLAWVDELASFALAGLLVPPPHYIRPSQAGVLKWFKTIADRSTVALILYDIPYRTGVQLERTTLLELAQHTNIRAIKDCGSDMAKTLALIAQGKLQVLAGEDLQLFATVAQGGSGAIAASAHLATARFVRLVQLLRSGDLTRARGLWTSLVPWIEAVFAEPNPAPLKAALEKRGEIANELRLPMVVATAEHTTRLAQLVSQFA